MVLSSLILTFFSNVAYSSEPTSNSKKVTNETQHNELLKQFVDNIDAGKLMTSNINHVDELLKKIPTEQDPVKQKKINAVYLASQENYKKVKIELEKQMKDELQLELKNTFTEEEIKYLLVLSKYKPFIKFQSFLMSEKYQSILEKPFVESRKTLISLKKQVDLIRAEPDIKK